MNRHRCVVQGCSSRCSHDEFCGFGVSGKDARGHYACALHRQKNPRGGLCDKCEAERERHAAERDASGDNKKGGGK